MKKDWRTSVVAILSLAGLEAMALSQGVDGVMFSLVAVAIAGIAGYNLEGILARLRGNNPK